MYNTSYSSVVLLDEKVNDNIDNNIKAEKPGRNAKIDDDDSENENDKTMIEENEEEDAQSKEADVNNKTETLIVGKLNNLDSKTTIEKESTQNITNNKQETTTINKINDNETKLENSDSKEKLNQLPKTLIKYDEKQLNSEAKKGVKKVNAITYFEFGTKGKPLIEIYVSPSCLHCAHFLIEDLDKFLTKHKEECSVKVMLIPVEAKDFFIMKIIQAEAKDTNGYYMIFSNYMKRALATIDSIKPTDEQKALYKGSNLYEEMIKFQVIANNFGFSDDKIINAIPNMNEDYECAIVEYYKRTVKEIFNKLKLDTKSNPEIEVPLIIYNGKSYKALNDALKACNENTKETPN